MNTDVTTPDAAERYFDASVFGRLYTLMAEALGPTQEFAPRRAAAVRRTASRIAAVPRERILDRLDRWFWRQEQEARDAYLGQSADVFELERRIAALERRGISRFY